jgi:phosphatidylserine decarboxylase
MAIWRMFGDVDLADAADERFPSMQAAFTRRLRPGARPFDPDGSILCSPSDGLLGAHGRVANGELLQIKGMPYTLAELLGREPPAWARDGCYATLRLTAGMYHRFHAPADLKVEEAEYISGDTWNVNPIALKRVESLFCRNERAVLSCALDDGTPLLIIPVAAILVAGIRLTFLDTPGLLRDGGPRRVPCRARLSRGEEMGWFEHGSTILLLAPAGVRLVPGLEVGLRLRAGEPLFRRDVIDRCRIASA